MIYGMFSEEEAKEIVKNDFKRNLRQMESSKKHYYDPHNFMEEYELKQEFKKAYEGKRLIEKEKEEEEEEER